MKLSNLTNDDGFTYIEVITAIFIFSLTGLLVWSGLTMAVTAVEKIIHRIRTANEISSLEYEFRNAVNSVDTDYWEIERKGEPFIFSQEEKRMVFIYGDKTIHYRNLYFNSLEYKDNCAVLHVETELATDIIIKANWGSYYFGINP